MTDEVVAAALRQGECVLERGRERLAVFLDGRAVIVEGEGGGKTSHFTRDDAEAAFREVVLKALADGFVPAKRAPPQVRPAPSVVQTRPPIAAPVERPLPAPAPVLTVDGEWRLAPPALRLTIDPIEGGDWGPLFERGPAGITLLDLEASTPDEALELLGERGLPTWVTGLGLLTFDALEDYCEAELDPTALWPLLGQLELLELRAGRSLTVPGALPRLASLSLTTSEARVELVEQLCAETWPALTSLELYLDARVPLRAAEVLSALRLDRFPRLAHLALRGLHEASGVVEALGGRALESLVVSHGDASGGFGASPFRAPSGIELLSDGRFYPLRSARF